MVLEAKMSVRRRMAKTSFAMLILTLGALMFAVFTGDKDTAEVLSSASGIVIMILGCFTAIVTAYMGIAHHNDLKANDEFKN